MADHVARVMEKGPALDSLVQKCNGRSSRGRP